jgi:hypothetical protein
LKPCQERIGGGQLIDAAATRRTFAEVGHDTGQFRVGEPTQRERMQFFVSRVVQAEPRA